MMVYDVIFLVKYGIGYCQLRNVEIGFTKCRIIVNNAVVQALKKRDDFISFLQDNKHCFEIAVYS